MGDVRRTLDAGTKVWLAEAERSATGCPGRRCRKAVQKPRRRLGLVSRVLPLDAVKRTKTGTGEA
jgi:hypothetical protein